MATDGANLTAPLLASGLAAARQRIVELEAEVARLKRALAERGAAAAPPNDEMAGALVVRKRLPLLSGKVPEGHGARCQCVGCRAQRRQGEGVD